MILIKVTPKNRFAINGVLNLSANFSNLDKLAEESSSAGIRRIRAVVE